MAYARGTVTVELAQLQYTLPRLAGEGVSPVAARGRYRHARPGEKDRDRPAKDPPPDFFELQQKSIRLQSSGASPHRAAGNDVKEVALVGYTNTGKSSLLNALTNAGVRAEDKLFATLDPVTRRVVLPDVGETVFTDTVGFIEKPPHEAL